MDALRRWTLTEQVDGPSVFLDSQEVAFCRCGNAIEIAVVLQVSEFDAATDRVGGCSLHKGFMVSKIAIADYQRATTGTSRNCKLRRIAVATVLRPNRPEAGPVALRICLHAGLEAARQT
jgi:hypothetical protein